MFMQARPPHLLSSLFIIDNSTLFLHLTRAFEAVFQFTTIQHRSR